MPSCHNPQTTANSRRVEQALERVHAFVRKRREADAPVEDFDSFERQAHEVMVELEREIVTEELARMDLDTPVVLVSGVPHRRVLRCEQTYMSAAGPLRVERTLYRASGGRAICPLELRAGIIDGFWTPRAARQGAWAVAHLTPQEAEELFGEMGGMRPSKSSLDRLPKELGARWEEQRAEAEPLLRQGETVVPDATTLAVSLDGVMMPMKDGERQSKREQSMRDGKRTRGPSGYQEASCATVSLHDALGERLRTVRTARMPEPDKVTLKEQLVAEAEHLLAQRPDLKVAAVADGARSNWEFLGARFPKAVQIVDFYHAAEHVQAALDAAYGESSSEARGQFEKLRHRLRHEDDGIEKIVRALRHLHDRFPRRKKLRTELRYFRRNRRRMRYTEFERQGLPLGSGVVEAACKTLVTARLKRSGMRWRHPGGQAILNFRSWQQSDRWDAAWAMLAATYVHDVSLPEKVIPLCRAA